MAEESKTREIADAVKGIVEAVPVYRDAVQPAAKEIGKGLETMAKAINLALEPVRGLVWGYDKLLGFLSTRVAEKLSAVPPDRIKPPSPHVVGPALEALRFTGHDQSLRELYANLLATSLDSDTARNAHPSFVDIIRNLSPDEARIMRLFATKAGLPVIDLQAKYKDGSGFEIFKETFSFIGREAGCEHPNLTPAYVNNLCRLGLLSMPEDLHFADASLYESLEQAEELREDKEQIQKDDKKEVRFSRKVIRLTRFGRQFCSACVIDKAAQ